MNYKIEGSGETVVFIHGLSDNLLYWEYLASNLKHDYQVLRVELRGHGESELGDDEITINLFVEDIKSLLDELDINSVHMVGFSLGGAVALEFALEYPKMMSSLVLMSSFCRVDEHLEDIFSQFKNALKSSFEDFYDLILPMVLCPEVIDENRMELEMLKEIAASSANTRAYIKAIDACSNFDVEGELSLIEIPTLVLAGKYDDITLLESQTELQSKIKDSKLIVFDDVKHNLLVGVNNEKILKIIKKELE